MPLPHESHHLLAVVITGLTGAARDYGVDTKTRKLWMLRSISVPPDAPRWRPSRRARDGSMARSSQDRQRSVSHLRDIRLVTSITDSWRSDDGVAGQQAGPAQLDLVAGVGVAVVQRRLGPSSSGHHLHDRAGAAGLGGPGRCWSRPTITRLPPLMMRLLCAVEWGTQDGASSSTLLGRISGEGGCKPWGSTGGSAGSEHSPY
jgi:hypothetical protein